MRKDDCEGMRHGPRATAGGNSVRQSHERAAQCAEFLLAIVHFCGLDR